MVTNEELSKRTGQPNDVAFYQQHKESCDRLMGAVIKQVNVILEELEKEPHIKENTEDLYDIGYITALCRAEREIKELINR